MRALAALALLLVVLLLVETGLRIGYPCDLMMWSESAFMTNMLKLFHGVPIYTDPSDLNSYIYSPGLEYLTYAILGPFGLALDVRFCRLVNVLIGLAAAVCAGMLASRVEGDLCRGRRDMWLLVVASCVAGLIIFNTQTADGLHPDNLHMFHASLCGLLCYEALRRSSLTLAAVTVMLAGLGVAVKQPAALAPVGATAALLLGRRWGARGTALLIAVLVGVATFITWFVLGDANRRFFILEVPASQLFLYQQAMVFLDNFFRGHRLLLCAMIPFSLAVMLRAEPSVARRFLLVWCVLGLAVAAPSVLPSLKILAVDNNLAVIGLWLCLVNAPAVGYLRNRPQPAAQENPGWLLLASLSIGVLLSLLPMKVPLPADAYRYCDDLAAAVGADLKAGRRVLLTSGTAPFLRNGFSAVPLDQAGPIGQLWFARKTSVLEALRRRLAARYYDRLYFVGDWIPKTLRLPPEPYVRIGQIAPPAPIGIAPWLFPYWGGVRFGAQMNPVMIYGLEDRHRSEMVPSSGR